MDDGIVTVAVKNAELKPLLVTWDHGDISNEEESNVQCEVLTQRNNSNAVTPVVATKNDENVYIGTKERSSELCDNYLVVRNKTTGEVKLYATDGYVMSQYQSNQHVKDKNNVTDNVPPDISYKKAILDLNKTFASKRVKRRAVEIEKMKINAGDIEENVKKAIESNQVTLNVGSVIPVNNMTFLPPCNRSATSIQETYKLHDIVSIGELNSVKSIAEEIKNSKISDLDPEKYSKFLITSVSHLKLKNILNIEILIVVDAFIRFLNLPYAKIKSRTPLCIYSSILDKKINNDFCMKSGDGRCRPNSMRDKTLCYIIVLMFIAFDYVLEMKHLSEYVSSIDYRRLPMLIRSVGAKQIRDTAVYNLSLPLLDVSVIGGNPVSVKRKLK